MYYEMWKALSGDRSYVEELRLGHTTVGTLTIPPLVTVAVEGGAGGTLDGDTSALDLQERAFPLLVAPGGLALEDDLGVVVQVRQVEGGSRGNGNVVEDDGGTASLGLAGRGSTGRAREGAAGASLDGLSTRSRGDHGGGRCHSGCRQGSRDKSSLENHCDRTMK